MKRKDSSWFWFLLFKWQLKFGFIKTSQDNQSKPDYTEKKNSEKSEEIEIMNHIKILQCSAEEISKMDKIRPHILK